ncbi:bifunctional helix-turn-helix transcriptional regulator/GNAT family N-acetyltransferase [Thermomonospora cellulosilytica]|uniref:DNA-binding MarR family transcriptional regulator/GNAT superfamily N-acetyltransferase n=1 Tax=Thermomonospora cellulosilytica TaxID=1411118 RepID=A0A7W3MZE8_9ACTN|nr:helix-turn-helix domain-containing GNAT family N-acetyltransferase [Thermomonospora cellulosilytica]MBA9004700.1 DNA-binding MarR family transcriptional regulator/GNAT superfamily N-acetyltransferase [Thermomonospora cellulosilytica]
MPVTADEIAAVRSFNRCYTRIIGVLGEGLLHTPYSLTEARVIFELGRREVAEVAALRRDLDLDPGYLSRMLARFESDGLIVRERAPGDARRQVARLTPAGRDVQEMLDKRAGEDIGALLERVPQTDRARLLTAMRTVQNLLAEPAPRSPVVLRQPRPGDLGWVVQRNGELYAAEYGWDHTYEALVARIVADFAADHDPGRERAWIAELDGERVGAVFCVRREETVAQLRLLLVEPSARGRGVGTRLVDECLRFAAGAGYAEMMLWTNDCLTAARRVYERAGFVLESQEPHHSFGRDLVGQYWRRPL